MTSRVFYSWQSDLPNSSNRGLIEKALQQAAKRIRGDGTIEVEPVIDRDTSGVPGSPDIASTIFQKIESASVFVADVSSINSGGRLPPLLAAAVALFSVPPQKRATPNPNVLVELGFAIGKLGWDRVLLVMNTAVGRIEDLPFDLRQRRIVTYECKAKNATSKGEATRQLSRWLEDHLRAILAVPPETSSVANSEPKVAHPAELIPKPQEIEHLYYQWDVMVREPHGDEDGWQRAQRHCTIRVVSEDLRRDPFQPEDERRFLQQIRETFSDDRGASLEDPDPQGMKVRHAALDLAFDRTWNWGRAGGLGVLGMAVTLPVVGVPEVYSLPDVVADVVRFLHMAGSHLHDKPALIWFELAAPELALSWVSSEDIRRGRLGGGQPESKPGEQAAFVQKGFDAGRLLTGNVVGSAAELFQVAITRAHRERTERADLERLAERELKRAAQGTHGAL